MNTATITWRFTRIHHATVVPRGYDPKGAKVNAAMVTLTLIHVYPLEPGMFVFEDIPAPAAN